MARVIARVYAHDAQRVTRGGAGGCAHRLSARLGAQYWSLLRKLIDGNLRSLIPPRHGAGRHDPRSGLETPTSFPRRCGRSTVLPNKCACPVSGEMLRQRACPVQPGGRREQPQAFGRGRVSRVRSIFAPRKRASPALDSLGASTPLAVPPQTTVCGGCRPARVAFVL